MIAVCEMKEVLYILESLFENSLYNFCWLQRLFSAEGFSINQINVVSLILLTFSS
jgi:hypothetical protein